MNAILVKVRFHYERGKDYSLFVLLISFALLSARLNFKRERSIKERKNAFSPLLVETGLNKKDTDSLINHSAVTKKCLSDYECKIHEALLIKKHQPKLNKQMYKNSSSFLLELF